MDVLMQSVRTLKGVGDSRAAKLKKLGVETVGQLLGFFPRDYEDRTARSDILFVQDGAEVVIQVHLSALPAISRPRKGLSLTRVIVSDGSGYMNCTWFNQEHIAKQLNLDKEYLFFGKIKRVGTKVEMTNPVIEPVDHAGVKTGRILPVYRLTQGLMQQHVRYLTEQALHHFQDQITEILPSGFKQQFRLSDAAWSVHNIHYPESEEALLKARRRLVFDELLMLQLGLAHLKGTTSKVAATPMKPCSLLPLLEKLPFHLTGAQERVWQELASDMRKPYRMNRLVQGDVGSGKTALAMLAIYMAAQNHLQSAFLVPTEILAEQHYRSIAPLFSELGISVGLLTGGLKKKEKEAIRTQMADGSLHLVIGTHALLEQNVAFHQLGLVVTDEQHRFGVRQRAILAGKGEQPHVMVMTATPIPRTLALVLYGDLEISVVDELPPGRKPIKTYAVTEDMRPRILAFVRKLVSEGRQVYFVCPLVEESDELEAEAAESLYEKLKTIDLPELRIAMIHGKMKSADKEQVMHAFSDGQVDVLVSTTVIEVGVNVPNATLMVVENAERFGLSQLHQLRGRVGRGADQSYCVLFNQGSGDIAKQRMDVMSQTNDGFVISEKDLELRGPGDVFGVRQHGLPEFHIANLYRDMPILQEVQQASRMLLEKNALHSDPAFEQLQMKLETLFENRLKEMTIN